MVSIGLGYYGGSQREYFTSMLCGWALLVVITGEEPGFSSRFSSTTFLLDTDTFLTL